MEYINNTVCDELFAEDDWDVQDDMMCAKNNDPTKQACFGDSGGPLYDRQEQKLVGVTSWGDSDCTSKSVVYARIAQEVSSKREPYGCIIFKLRKLLNSSFPMVID